MVEPVGFLDVARVPSWSDRAVRHPGADVVRPRGDLGQRAQWKRGALAEDLGQPLLCLCRQRALGCLADRLMTEGTPGQGLMRDENRQRTGEKNRPHSPPPGDCLPGTMAGRSTGCQGTAGDAVSDP